MCDSLYPRYYKYDPDSCQFFIKVIYYLLSMSHMLPGFNSDVENLLEAILYPFVHQQALASRKFTNLMASPLTESYYISVAKSSKQIFITFSLFELGFCIIVFALSEFKRIPETSHFVDFNLITMFDHADETIPDGRLTSRLLSNNSGNFVNALFEKRLQVRDDRIKDTDEV